MREESQLCRRLTSCVCRAATQALLLLPPQRGFLQSQERAQTQAHQARQQVSLSCHCHHLLPLHCRRAQISRPSWSSRRAHGQWRVHHDSSHRASGLSTRVLPSGEITSCLSLSQSVPQTEQAAPTQHTRACRGVWGSQVPGYSGEAASPALWPHRWSH